MEHDNEENQKIKKEIISYLAIISWLIYGLKKTSEQDKKLNLFLTEKDNKELNSD